MTLHNEIFAGLQAIADDAFPRACAVCGRTIASPDAFVHETEAIRGRSGLKQSWDDDDRPIVELYRNCPCGSTLMEFFGDRRDTSPAGNRRRERFGQVLDRVVAAGVPREIGREEILRLLRGEPSVVLANHGVHIRTQ